MTITAGGSSVARSFSRSSMPVIPGMFRSVTTTSGANAFELPDRLERVGGHLDLVALIAE